jgi:hypothetical protein
MMMPPRDTKKATFWMRKVSLPLLATTPNNVSVNSAPNRKIHPGWEIAGTHAATVPLCSRAPQMANTPVRATVVSHVVHKPMAMTLDTVFHQSATKPIRGPRIRVL